MKKVSSYIELSQKLRGAILSGKYTPGARLPSERDLEEELDVSRVTIRRALRVLEQERLVQRRHGSGTFVSPTPSRRIPLMIDYTGSMRDHAPNLERTLRLWRHQPAEAMEAQVLNIDRGMEIVYAERSDTINGNPVACDQAYIVESFANRLRDQDLAHVDFIETWMRRERFEITECRQTIEAVPANPEISRALGISRGRPVLKSTEVYLTLNERPAGLFISFYHPGHICISSSYRWTDAVTGKHSNKKVYT